MAKTYDIFVNFPTLQSGVQLPTCTPPLKLLQLLQMCNYLLFIIHSEFYYSQFERKILSHFSKDVMHKIRNFNREFFKIQQHHRTQFDLKFPLWRN